MGTEQTTYEFTETMINETAPIYQQSAKAELTIYPIIPAIPANFKAKIGECGSKSIELSWNDVENESHYILNIFDSSYNKEITIPKNTISYVDTDLKDGQIYNYKLKACNGAGCSRTTPVIRIKAPPECQAFQILTIKRSGNGFGKNIVRDKKNKNTCDLSLESNNQCEYKYPKGSKLILRAQNSRGSVFKKWGGDCSGISKTCKINLLSDKTVEAVFILKK